MMQDSNTEQLVFKAPFLISYLSRFMTLLPGDVVSTGTPGGVGAGFKPPIFLKAGDEIELGCTRSARRGLPQACVATCRCVPRPSIPNSISSPAFKKIGGLNPAPTPPGVPVEITSPGSSVMKRLR